MIRFILIACILGLLPCYAAGYTPELIKDELVEKTLSGVSDVYPEPNLDYDYSDKNIKYPLVPRVRPYRSLHYDDKLVKLYLQDVSSDYPEANLNYDYTKVKFLPLHIRFVEEIYSHGDKNEEGEIVKFKVIRDVEDGGRVIVPQGTIGTAKIETISPNGFMGVPAEVIVAHFNVPGLERKKIEGEVDKTGMNFMGLAGALKYSIGTFIPGTGYLFMLIKGGHVKINTYDVYEIKYVP